MSKFFEIKSFSKKEKSDGYCFLWSILAYLNPCENNHRSRVRNYTQYFN